MNARIAALLVLWSLPAWADDPVVVHDAATGVSITQSIVAEIVKADADAVGLFDLPKPGPDAEAQVAAALKADFPTTDPGMKRWLGHAKEYLPLGLPYLRASSPATQAKFIAFMKPQVLKAKTAGSRLVNLSEFLVGLGQRSASHGMGAANSPVGRSARFSQTLQSQQMTQHFMQQGMRSAYTSCNTYNGAMQQNWSFCHP